LFKFINYWLPTATFVSRWGVWKLMQEGLYYLWKDDWPRDNQQLMHQMFSRMILVLKLAYWIAYLTDSTFFKSLYFNRLCNEGGFKQKKLVLSNISLSQISCQQMEMIIYLMKKYSRKRNNGSAASFINIANYLDLHCGGQLMAELICFVKLFNEMKRDYISIYDEITTPMNITKLESELPTMAKKMVDALNNIKLGEKLPPILERVLSLSGDNPDDVEEAVNNLDNNINNNQDGIDVFENVDENSDDDEIDYHLF
jgi:hypothetical protein